MTGIPNATPSAILAAVIIAASMAAGGCATTPEARYYQALRAFNATVERVVVAKQAGLIEQDTYDQQVLPVIIALDETLTAAERAIESGDDAEAIDYLASIQSLLDRLILNLPPPLQREP